MAVIVWKGVWISISVFTEHVLREAVLGGAPSRPAGREREDCVCWAM